MLLSVVIFASMGVTLVNCFPARIEIRDKQVDYNDCEISEIRGKDNENVNDTNLSENGIVYENEIKSGLNEEEFSECPQDLTDAQFYNNYTDTEIYSCVTKPLTKLKPEVTSSSSQTVSSVTVAEPKIVPDIEFQTISTEVPKSISTGSTTSISEDFSESTPLKIPELNPITDSKPSATELPITNPINNPQSTYFDIPQLIPFGFPETMPFIISILRSIMTQPIPMPPISPLPFYTPQSIGFPFFKKRRSSSWPIMHLSQRKLQTISGSTPQIIKRTGPHPRSMIDASNKNSKNEASRRSRSDVDLEQMAIRKGKRDSRSKRFSTVLLLKDPKDYRIKYRLLKNPDVIPERH